MAECVYANINENWSFGSRVEMEVHGEMQSMLNMKEIWK
jgi:hypothetical protein